MRKASKPRPTKSARELFEDYLTRLKNEAAEKGREFVSFLDEQAGNRHFLDAFHESLRAVYPEMYAAYRLEVLIERHRLRYYEILADIALPDASKAFYAYKGRSKPGKKRKAQRQQKRAERDTKILSAAARMELAAKGARVTNKAVARAMEENVEKVRKVRAAARKAER